MVDSWDYLYICVFLNIYTYTWFGTLILRNIKANQCQLVPSTETLETLTLVGCPEAHKFQQALKGKTGLFTPR